MDIRQFTRANFEAIPAIQMITTGVLLGALMSGEYTVVQWLIPVGIYFLTGCLGVTMTFHRFLTHRSFVFRSFLGMKKFFEYLFSLLGALGGTGSALGWVSVHLRHHKYADTVYDPHSPVTQKWKVLFGAYQHEFDIWAVRGLVTDRFHRFIHDYYFGILAVWAILLGVISVHVLVLGFIIPVAIQIWVSNLSNYFNHSHGYQNFETKDESRNLWWLALPSWGEAWHNLHHRFPWSANFGIRWWEFDLTYLMIRLFGKDIRILGPSHKALLL